MKNLPQLFVSWSVFTFSFERPYLARRLYIKGWMNEDGGTLIDLIAERNKRGLDRKDPYYQVLINRMSKMELLEEMVRFQEDRSQKENLSLTMMVRGRILFRALELNAETDELRLLASSYRRHLEHEIEIHSRSI